MMWLDGEDNSEETEDGEEWSDSSPESRFENYFSSSRPKNEKSSVYNTLSTGMSRLISY